MGWIIFSLVGLFLLLVIGIVAFAKCKFDKECNHTNEKTAKIVKVQKQVVEEKIVKEKVVAKKSFAKTIKKPVAKKPFVKTIKKPVVVPKPKVIIKTEKVYIDRKTSLSYYVQPWQSKNGWRFRIKHRNGQIIASSEAYSTKQAMEKTLKTLTKQLGLKIKEKIEYKKK